MELSDVEGFIPMKNVFDQNNPTVPVVVEIAGDKRVVGDATLINTEEGVKVEMTLNTDDPAEAIEFLSGGITGLSVKDEDYSLADAEALFELPEHDHNPVQHRDGRPPWCNECGLDVNLETPISRLPHNKPTPPGNFGFPKPSRLHD